MRLVRQFLPVLVLSSTLSIILLVLSANNRPVHPGGGNNNDERNTTSTAREGPENGDHLGLGCHLPTLDPFHPSVLPYVHVPSRTLDCAARSGRPILFYNPPGSNHLVTLQDPGKYGLTNCCYKQFTPNEAAFGGTILPTCHPIQGPLTPISPDHEFIFVYCTKKKSSTSPAAQVEQQLLIDGFNFVHARRPNRFFGRRRRPAPSRDQLNIVVLGIDGVSHMNFIRTMPSSSGLLRGNESSWFSLNGYSKVGDNTYPNVWPLLTGLPLEQIEGVGGCGSGEHVDTCPLIWQNFSAAGYVTALAEDAIGSAIFNKGWKPKFKSQPTDFYLHPWAHQLEAFLGHSGLKTGGQQHLCYGPRTGFRTLLDSLHKLGTTMGLGHGDRKYFSFTWATSLTHDDLNNGFHGDHDLLRLLQFYESGPQAANTFVLLLSDHGIRTGPILTTVQGRLEERLPFAYLRFPDWFQVKYGAAMQNLRGNSERLVTTFDLHKTLLNLQDPDATMTRLALEQKKRDREHHRGRSARALLSRGLSLFTPVPRSRTCEDAAIDPHWCVCHAMTPLTDPGEHPLAASAVTFIISWLNSLLANQPKCARLELVSVLAASVYNGNGTSSTKTKLAVTFEVSPSQAKFEATVVQVGPPRNGGDQLQWQLGGDELSRLNLYGNQSHCVTVESKLKKYCFCLE